jgi:hypothetical protein
MRPRTSPRNQNTGFDLFMMPMTALNVLNPFLAGAAIWNSRAYEGFATLVPEWQDFLARRFEQDLTLLQRLAACRSPDQIWTANVEFWQRAADDYGKQFATMMKLPAAFTAKSLAATQVATEDAMNNTPVAKAA